MPKYFIDTFGCQMNFHDAERMAGLLEADGYAPTSDERDADLVVINTCSVRERAVDKLFSRLGEVREVVADRVTKPVVAVTGCVAQQEGDRLFARDRSIDVVVGTQRLKELPALARAAGAGRTQSIDVSPHDDVSFPLGLIRRSDQVRAWVTIIEGCNEFCAFCVVPRTRGHERMRPVREIVADVGSAVASGRREIQLLGQIVNHYRAPDDGACDFAELLRRVGAVPGVLRVRFASPHPRHVSDRMIEAVATLPQVCKHLHLPVQSGSDRMLSAMRRRHTRADYLALVDRLREAVPAIALSTDIIVGFPGETGEDFEATLDLIRTVRFHAIYSFKYSPRPGTLAIKRMPDDVPEGEKARRIVALQRLQAEIQMEWHERAVGSETDVLVDSLSRRRATEVAGRTSGNTVVNLPGGAELIGQLVRVRVTEAAPNSLRGVLADVPAAETRVAVPC